VHNIAIAPANLLSGKTPSLAKKQLAIFRSQTAKVLAQLKQQTSDQAFPDTR